MGRAFSWSLAAHAVFIVSFLLLSATRQPLSIPQVARPVRLVTFIESAAPPRPRAAAPTAPEPVRIAAAPVAAPLPQPAAPPAPTPALPPAADSRVVIPARAETPPVTLPPTAPAAGRPGLSERLAQRLAAAAPVESRSAEVVTPRVASLLPTEPVAPAPNTDPRAVGAPPAPTDAVTSVGYFPHAWYLAVLKENVFARWSPPSDMLQTSRPPAARVAFRIDRAGRISGISLKESSGFARFDRSALVAVQSLGRVPGLPEQYREENLDVVIRFENQR